MTNLYQDGIKLASTVSRYYDNIPMETKVREVYFDSECQEGESITIRKNWRHAPIMTGAYSHLGGSESRVQAQKPSRTDLAAHFC